MRSKDRLLIRYIPLALTVVLFGASCWTVKQEFDKYPPDAIFNSLDAISNRDLCIAVGLMLVNYLFLIGYDWLGVIYIKRSLPWNKIALVSVLSHAISNSVGLSFLSGSAIRYRFYSNWGFSALEIAKIIAFCNFSFWLGLFAIGGIIFLMEPLAIPQLLNLPFQSVYPLGGIFLIIVLSYFIWNLITQKNALRIGQFEIPHFPIRLSIAQILITSFDWALAGAILYTLLPGKPGISYIAFFSAYLLAQIAGTISNVPGGLGVVETILLLLLSSSLDSDKLLAGLVAYRCVYYVFPLVSAVSALGFYEVRKIQQHS